MKISALLLDAAARIRQGWVQLKFSDGPRVCATIAIYDASMARELDYRAKRAARTLPLLPACYEAPSAPWADTALRYLRRAAGDFEVPVPGSPWFSNQDFVINLNDRPGQTAENIAALMELAAILAEQDECAGVPTAVPSETAARDAAIAMELGAILADESLPVGLNAH